MTPAELNANLIASAAARYRTVSRFAFHFARGKLSRDPVFAALLARGLLPAARVLDLGCGQGLLAAWLLAAQNAAQSGRWCREWAAPPKIRSIFGIELMLRDVTRARQALGKAATFLQGDICHTPFPASDTIVIFDVLHYLNPAQQEDVLSRARAALAGGGVLLLRIGDASGGRAFQFSNWVDRAVLFARGHGWARLHCRSVPQWLALLARLGFRTDAMPMHVRTPFANVLLVGRVT